MFVAFIRARNEGRLVHSGAPCGSLGSFGGALGVVGFIRVRRNLSGALWCAFGMVAFIRARSQSGRVHQGS